MDEFMWKVGIALAEMRLIIEGAVLLYEDVSPPFFQTARAEGRAADIAVLETLQGALCGIRDRICELQTEYEKTALNQH